MITSLSRSTPVLVQGITGRMGRAHTANMRAFGTNIVAGTAARADISDVDGIPVFTSCADAVAATRAIASIAMVPPADVLRAVTEAVTAGIRLVVTIAEGVPVHDALHAGRVVRAAGATWVGASTPGLAVPGEMKLGFLPNVSLHPGPLSLMSKSGTLSYEVGYRLAREGIGTSYWVGVGGDAVKGVRFADLLTPFLENDRTKGIVLVGEVGGDEEEQFAAALEKAAIRKPVYAIVAGKEAKEGVSMGHAGALTYGESGTLASKHKSLRAAGAGVFASIEDLVAACVHDLR